MSGRVRRVGPYEIERELGRGGMGAVFQARDVELGRAVALKVLMADRLASTPARKRFEREALALAKARHPYVIGVHASGEDDGRPWIAMDLAVGTLGDRLDEGPLPPREAAELVGRLAEALTYMHGRGILHRDLKPSNVLFDEQGMPRLTDFGLARQLDPALSRLSESGIAAGTPGYMAPEQVRGETELDETVDVYGLGGILYATMTGQRPFVGRALELLVATVSSDPPPPSSLEPAIPPALDAITLRCLAKAPADRYASAEAVRADLARYLDGTWRPPPRRGLGALAMLLIALISGALAALLTPPGAAPPETPSRDDDSAAAAQAALRQARDLPPHAAYPALQAWLTDHPAHPRRDQARRALAALREAPLWAVDVPVSDQPGRQPRHLKVTWWGEHLLVWFHQGREVELWLPGAAERRLSLPADGKISALLPLDDVVVIGLTDGRLRWVTGEGTVRAETAAFAAEDAVPDRSWGRAVTALSPSHTEPGAVWAGSNCALLRRFDPTGARQHTLAHREPVTCLEVVDAQTLISGGGWSVVLSKGQEEHADHTLRTWSPRQRGPVTNLRLAWRATHLALGDDLVVIANSNDEVRVFRRRGYALEPDGYLAGDGIPRVEDGDFIAGKPALPNQIHGLALDATRIYAGGDSGDAGEVRAWSRETRDQVLRWRFRASVTGLALRGDLLAIGQAGGRLELWALPPAE